MKVSPISGDTLVQLALIAAGLGLAYYLWRRTAGAVGDAVGSALEQAGAVVSDVADAVIIGTNPVNPDNWVNRGVTAAGDLIVSEDGPGRNADGSWTLGGAMFDLMNPGWSANLSGPVMIPTPVSAPVPTGGAAFGFFPQLGRQKSAVTTIAQRGRVVGGL